MKELYELMKKIEGSPINEIKISQAERDILDYLLKKELASKKKKLLILMENLFNI